MADDDLMAGAAVVDLAALVGSRICHDLVSPLGAIGNGIELLMLDRAAMRPEIGLIADSVASANARLRFLRVAFGVGGASQQLGGAEVARLLDDLHRNSRLTVTWQVDDDQSRPAVRRAFLGLMCLASALPLGGQIAVTAAADEWRLLAAGPRVTVDLPLWSLLTDRLADYPLDPTQVQFGLLRDDLLGQGLLGQGTLARLVAGDNTLDLAWDQPAP